MAVQKGARKGQSGSNAATGEVIEQRLIAFAEQLGTLVGTVQSKAEGWLDRDAISKEVERIRDGAADLLEQVTAMAPSTDTLKSTFRSAAASSKKAAASKSKSSAKGSAKKPVAKPAQPKAAAAPQGRGLVDAPGKRHRQPPPQERGSKRMNLPKGSQTAPALAKATRRGNR